MQPGLPSSADERPHSLSKTKSQIYLGDHLTRSWTRDERGGLRQPGSPVTSDPGANNVSSTAALNQTKFSHAHASLSRRGTSSRDQRGNRKHWATRATVQSVPAKEYHQWKESFDSLLGSQIGVRLFHDFLKSQVAEENLLFWQACEELKQTIGEKAIQKLVQKIFSEFISVHSNREVNIEYRMREDIVEQLNSSEAASPNIFNDAQRQIYELMRRDSYPRFLTALQTMREMTGERRESTNKRKNPVAKRKTRVLCCHGNESDDAGAARQFVRTEEEAISRVHEHRTTTTFEQRAKPSSGKRCESSETSVITMTSLKDTVKPSPQNGNVEITPPGVVECSRKMSYSSSRRESGIELTSCDDDATPERACDVISVASAKDARKKNVSEIEVPVDVIIEPESSGIVLTDRDDHDVTAVKRDVKTTTKAGVIKEHDSDESNCDVTGKKSQEKFELQAMD